MLSYGIKIDPEGYEEARELAEAMIEQDMYAQEQEEKEQQKKNRKKK